MTIHLSNNTNCSRVIHAKLYLFWTNYETNSLKLYDSILNVKNKLKLNLLQQFLDYPYNMF